MERALKMYTPFDKSPKKGNHEIPINPTGGGLKRMALNDTKAGMEGLDVDKINQIIEAASRGSKFYVHQQNQQEKLNIRIQSILESFQNLTEEQIQQSTLTVIGNLILQVKNNHLLYPNRWTKWQQKWNSKEF